MMPVCQDRSNRTLFAYGGLGTNAYWGEGFSDLIGLTVSAHALCQGNPLTRWMTDDQTRAKVCGVVTLIGPT